MMTTMIIVVQNARRFCFLRAFAVGTFEILPFKSRKKTCGLRDTEPTRSGVHSERLEVVFVFIRLRFPLGGNTK